VNVTLYGLLKKRSGAEKQGPLPWNFTVEKAEPLQPDTHCNRRDHERYGKRPGKMLKHLIVTDLVEGADNCRCVLINIGWNDDSILLPKHAGMIIAELIAPCLRD
jgi:hypothetical protein